MSYPIEPDPDMVYVDGFISAVCNTSSVEDGDNELLQGYVVNSPTQFYNVVQIYERDIRETGIRTSTGYRSAWIDRQPRVGLRRTNYWQGGGWFYKRNSFVRFDITDSAPQLNRFDP